jgi:hypothetical protein
MKKLVPAILGWLVVVITLALAPTIETYNGHVTTNVAAATNAAYMIGMTAIDDFGGFIMIMALLVGGGLFAVGGMKQKNVTVADMLSVIGSVIISVIALAIFSGSIVGYIDSLVTAGSGFAKTAYGILATIIYVLIIGGAGSYLGTKSVRSSRRSRRSVRLV